MRSKPRPVSGPTGKSPKPQLQAGDLPLEYFDRRISQYRAAHSGEFDEPELVWRWQLCPADEVGVKTEPTQTPTNRLSLPQPFDRPLMHGRGYGAVQ
jgi:hypothetical protein